MMSRGCATLPVPVPSPTVRIDCRLVGAFLAALSGASCASAPPVAPPPPSYETKMMWVLRLEDQRILRDQAPPAPIPANPRAKLPPSPPVPDLLALLGDTEARIRRRAALAVGRVGMSDGIGPLVGLLANDPDAEVRQMAAFALGLIADPAAIQPLRAALDDASPLVQGRAGEALGMIGDRESAGAIAGMVRRQATQTKVGEIPPDEGRYPLDSPVEAFRLGIYALARLKQYEALASAVLDERGQPVSRWWPVAYALQRVEDPRALPALLSLISSEGHYTRTFAIKGAGALKGTQAVPTLIQLAGEAHASPAIAVEAVRALGNLDDLRSVPTLSTLAASADLGTMLRAEAVTALGTLHAQAAVPLTLDLLSDRSPIIRSAATRALVRMDPEQFITVLSASDPDKDWTVRAALAASLVDLDPDISIPRLLAMLGDQDQRVVPAVLASLVKLRAPDAERFLLERLKSDDFVVRMAAATHLGELKPETGPAALIDAYRFGQRDNTYVARAAALTALAQYGPAAAAETMRAALADKDWSVRVRAVEMLRRFDPSADVAAARPAPTTMPLEDYGALELVNPMVSAHVYLDTDKGTIQLELAVLDAPLTCRNFIQLARSGFFNGLAIHRVVTNFVLQDGDPRGDGEGGPGYTIRDELNERPYLRGTAGMALDWKDTGGSQFFVTHSPQPHLDARYTAFGYVVGGMEVVDRLDQGDVIRRVRVWDGQQMTRN